MQRFSALGRPGPLRSRILFCRPLAVRTQCVVALSPAPLLNLGLLGTLSPVLPLVATPCSRPRRGGSTSRLGTGANAASEAPRAPSSAWQRQPGYCHRITQHRDLPRLRCPAATPMAATVVRAVSSGRAAMRGDGTAVFAALPPTSRHAADAEIVRHTDRGDQEAAEVDVAKEGVLVRDGTVTQGMAAEEKEDKEETGTGMEEVEGVDWGWVRRLPWGQLQHSLPVKSSVNGRTNAASSKQPRRAGGKNSCGRTMPAYFGSLPWPEGQRWEP